MEIEYVDTNNTASEFEYLTDSLRDVLRVFCDFSEVLFSEFVGRKFPGKAIPRIIPGQN